MTSEHAKRYGPAHQRLRRWWAPQVARGTVPCARCGYLIRVGQLWHLDHDDLDPTKYIGPSHARCNTRTWDRLTPQQQARSSYGKGWANARKTAKRSKPKPQVGALPTYREMRSRDW